MEYIYKTYCVLELICQYMEKSPLVSVIMPTYNGEKYIEQALLSVLQQSYPQIDIFVCDDASKDQTPELIQNFKVQHDTKDQIHFIQQHRNLGISRNMNTGLEASDGKYIAILDQDDIRLDPDKIMKQVMFLENNPNHGIIGTNCIIGINGKEKRTTLPYSDEGIRAIALGKCPMQHSAVVYQKEILDHIGPYSPKFKCAPDYDIFLRILKYSKGANLPEYMTFYRNHKSNVSNTENKQQKKEALELTRTNRSQFSQQTKALIYRTGSFVLSTLIPNTELYRELQIKIKDYY